MNCCTPPPPSVHHGPVYRCVNRCGVERILRSTPSQCHVDRYNRRVEHTVMGGCRRPCGWRAGVSATHPESTPVSLHLPLRSGLAPCHGPFLRGPRDGINSHQHLVLLVPSAAAKPRRGVHVLGGLQEETGHEGTGDRCRGGVLLLVAGWVRDSQSRGRWANRVSRRVRGSSVVAVAHDDNHRP